MQMYQPLPSFLKNEIVVEQLERTEQHIVAVGHKLRPALLGQLLLGCLHQLEVLCLVVGPDEETALEIERKLRAFTPWPGIFTFYINFEKNENKRRIQLTKVEVVNESFESGKVYPELIVGTRTGGLRILRLKPEGKQEMDANSFLRGNLQIVGSALE